MVEDELTPAERAARTKRRRTDGKLMTAAEFWVREVGIDARAEDIAEDAGVSVATFYNFFPTRTRLFRRLMLMTCYEPIQDVSRSPGTLADVPYTQQIYLGAMSGRVRNNINVVRGALSTRYDTQANTGWMDDPFEAFTQSILIVSGAWLEERNYSNEDREMVRAATMSGLVGALDFAVHHPAHFELNDLLQVPAANALKFRVG